MARYYKRNNRRVVAQDLSDNRADVYPSYVDDIREIHDNMRKMYNNMNREAMNRNRIYGNGDGFMENDNPNKMNYRDNMMNFNMNKLNKMDNSNDTMPNDVPIEDKRDFDIEAEYWKNMYPQEMKMLQQYIDEICDKMDYNGSVMYDEFPDKITLKRISKNIYQMMLNDGVVQEEDNSSNNNTDTETEQNVNEYDEEDDDGEAGFYKNIMDLGSSQIRPPYPPRPPYGPGPVRPPRPPKPPYGPGSQRPPICSGRNCIADIIDVLLYNEMHRRRCRNNRCF